MKKWQNFWSENQSFEPSDDKTKEKIYLSMFPYHGRIHMGHVRNYCLGDAFARHFRKSNFNVFTQLVGIVLVCLLKMQQLKINYIQKMDLWKYWLYERWIKSFRSFFLKLENLQLVMNFIQNGNKSSLLKCMKKTTFI